jgi:actin related protein 2/3 complex subunit 2
MRTSLEPTALDSTIVDFDGVVYHVSTPAVKEIIRLSLSWQCYNELVRWGAPDLINREYGPYVCSETEESFDLTLEFNLQQLPENKGSSVAMIHKQLETFKNSHNNANRRTSVQVNVKRWSRSYHLSRGTF